ncbi:MAG: putative metal-dependent hydrolase [Bryobacteraceae bacterium]
MTDLRYPIGPFEPGPPVNEEWRRQLVQELAGSPARLRAAVAGLSGDRLDTPYRPGGWTVRQVVHHLADAQMNWYVRTRLALTEFEPIVKPFDEVLWAELADARSGPVEPSLLLCDAVCARWVALFESLSRAEWTRRMLHPERGTFVLNRVLPMHVWHARHHTAQITALRQRMGWL